MIPSYKEIKLILFNFISLLFYICQTTFVYEHKKKKLFRARAQYFQFHNCNNLIHRK